MTDDQTNPRTSVAVAVWPVAILLLAVGYVLSIGLVQWSVNRGYLPEFFRNMHAPVWFCAYQYEPAERALWWYLEQWSVYPAPHR